MMLTTSEHTIKYALEPWQLFVDKAGEKGSYSIGIPIILMLILSFGVYKKIELKYRNFYITSIILGIISLVMSTKLFPWMIMPNFLCMLQFPWRLIGFALLFLSPVCAINVYYLFKSIKKKDIRD